MLILRIAHRASRIGKRVGRTGSWKRRDRCLGRATRATQPGGLHEPGIGRVELDRLDDVERFIRIGHRLARRVVDRVPGRIEKRVVGRRRHGIEDREHESERR